MLEDKDNKKRKSGVWKLGGMAAAVVIVFVILLAGGMQLEAVKLDGFFHWLKADKTGKQMVTAPENLDSNTEVNITQIYDLAEELPGWAGEWIEIMEAVEMAVEFEQKQYEVKEFQHSKSVEVKYRKAETDKSIALGTIIYQEQVTFNTELFENYRMVEQVELNGRLVEVYENVEESGRVFRRIVWGEENKFFFVQGESEMNYLLETAGKYMDILDKI